MDNEKAGNKSTKKPFDKKLYRLKKYSNKFKVQQWEERRKKATQRVFLKSLTKEERQKLIDTKSPNKEFSSKPKPNGFVKAKQEFFRKQQEKQQKKEAAERKKQEREEALNKYKEKKLKKLKAISQRTRKGQPLMRDRLQLLLEKIQEKY